MTFGQLIEYNIEIFLLKNHTRNVVEKLSPDPFLKNQNWAYLWINSLKVLYSLFLLYANQRAFEIKWNKAADHLLLLYTTLF